MTGGRLWPGRGRERELWRRCRRIAATVTPPSPFDPSVFAAALSARLGRTVELLPLPAGSLGPCGVLVSTDRADYIGYPADTTPLHQQHIVLHEVGHLLCGHHDTADRGPADADTGAGAAARELLPHLSPELVRRVLGRSAYSEVQEQEAEVFASLVLHRTARLPAAPTAPGSAEAGGPAEPRPGGATARLGGLFGPSARSADEWSSYPWPRDG